MSASTVEAVVAIPSRLLEEHSEPVQVAMKTSGDCSNLTACCQGFVLRCVALHVARHSIGRILGDRWSVSGHDQGHQHHLLVSLHHKGAQDICRGGEELRDE